MTDAEPAPAAVALRSAAVRAGDQSILEALDISIAEASRVAVIGPSGAGKTTLLRLIGGVLWPTAGTVHTLGMPIGELDARATRALRRRIGFLHQQDNLVPGLRVAHNVLMGRLGHWSLWRSLRSLLWPLEVDAARAALARVELADKLWAHPGTLSGGEQQRVAFARLLLQGPDLILADEPVSALDLRLGREVVRLLLGLANDRRATLVVSLHTLELLGEGFDRVIALRQGKVFWDGTPAQLHRDLLRDLYGAEYHALHLDELEMRSEVR